MRVDARVEYAIVIVRVPVSMIRTRARAVDGNESASYALRGASSVFLFLRTTRFASWREAPIYPRVILLSRWRKPARGGGVNNFAGWIQTCDFYDRARRRASSHSISSWQEYRLRATTENRYEEIRSRDFLDMRMSRKSQFVEWFVQSVARDNVLLCRWAYKSRVAVSASQNCPASRKTNSGPQSINLPI